MEEVVVTFKFNKELPNPKPEFWIGDVYQELQRKLAGLAHDIGWGLEWRSTEFEPKPIPKPKPETAFTKNTHNENVLWEEIKNVTESVMNSVYGTDPRHTLLAHAVADEVAFGKKVPWDLGKHFGRD